MESLSGCAWNGCPSQRGIRSPSAAAGVIRGGTAPGPISWKNQAGRTLKEIEGDA
ncbi:DUF4357 domain-containing protein [Pseudomonas aeruginosa]